MTLKPVKEPAREIAEESAGESAELPAGEPMEEYAEAPVEQSAEASVEGPAETPEKEIAEEPAEEPAADPAYFAMPEDPSIPEDSDDPRDADAPEEEGSSQEPPEAADPVYLDEGFFIEDGKLLYADGEGAVRRAAGWFSLNGNMYYSSAEGVFYRDCSVTLGESEFSFDASGKLLIGFYYKDGCLRFTDPMTFITRTSQGWFTVNGKTYFSDAKGNLYHDRFIHTSATDYYWMSEDGSTRPGTTVVVNGIPYELDGQGMVVKKGGWGETGDGRRFYRDPDSGMPVTNKFFDPDGEGECFAGSDGLMITGWKEIEGRWMYFDRTTARRVYGRFDEEALNGFNGRYYYTAMPGMSYGCCTGFVGFMAYNLYGIEDYPHTVSSAAHRNGGEYVDAHMIWLLENAEMVGKATIENRKVVYEGETYQPGDIIVFNNRSDGFLGELSPGISSPNYDTWKVDGYAVLEHIAIVGWSTDGVPEGQYNMHHNTSTRNVINDDSPEQFILNSPPNGKEDGRSRSYYVFRFRQETPEGDDTSDDTSEDASE